MLWRGLITLVLLCYPTMAMAQRHFPTRQELDSLVNPAPSKVAAGVFTVDARHKNIGTIEAGEVVRVQYKLRNNTAEPITITTVGSSCSCLRVGTRPQEVMPNSEIIISGLLNTEKRKGEFRYNILVYTTLDSDHPTERLTLEGVIENDDDWLHLPESMGELRLTRKEVIIEGHCEERIPVANTSTKPVRLTAPSTIEGLTLHTEPEVIEAGGEGYIVISYKPKSSVGSDLNTMFIVEGVDASAMERTIKVKLRLERDLYEKN